MRSVKFFVATSLFTFLVTSAFLVSASFAVETEVTSEPDVAAKAMVTSNMMKLPMRFEKNSGQMDERVRFMSRGSGYTLFLTDTGEAVLSLRSKIEKKSVSEDAFPKETAKYKTSVIRMKLDGSNQKLDGGNQKLEVTGNEKLAGTSNYFIGNDKSKWRASVPNYEKVKYTEVYSGIDLVYYGNQRKLEYDFIVSAGADPSLIALVFEGVNSTHINENGELVLSVGDGEVVLKAPITHQTIDGARVDIDSRFIMSGENRVAFALGDYDKSKKLVIDPILTYSTYLGGSGSDVGKSIALDGDGNVYVTGYTDSTDFPTVNQYQTDQTTTDVFVTKLNAAGSAWTYSTYLGGSGADSGYGIAVDSSGSAYVTGSTFSTDFPTQGPVMTDPGDTNGDVFVTKINSAGSALIYSTYLGGNDTDSGNGIAIDSSGNAYVTGPTQSTDFPTQNPIMTDPGDSNWDGFVTKINSAGSAWTYSTYLGGSGSDGATSIAIDDSGAAYVTGHTASTDFPTQNPIMTDPGDSNWDVFVTKVNSAGSAWTYSTYLGGDSGDQAKGLAVDSSGAAYVTGYTQSTDFPTVNPIQTDQTTSDAFVTKVNAGGTAWTYSTYLGGDAGESGYGITVDSSGNAYVTGVTYSTDFPTQNPIMTDPGDTNSDVFVTKLNTAGSALTYSTYLGGSSSDEGNGIAVDSSGTAYATGYTSSTDFPTQNPIMTDQTSSDAFVIKIADSTWVGMYRAYNPNADAHFFTTSFVEFANAVSAGYTDETSGPGFPFYVLDAQVTGTAGVYRLYNPNNGRHYYTASEGEKNYLVGIGWLWQSSRIEGYVYTSLVSGTTEVFKLYNNNSGVHLYTASVTEKDAILAAFPGIWVLNTSLGYASVSP